MSKIFTAFFAVILFVVIVAFFYFFVGSAPQAKKITWGVNFSQMQAEALKLDWRKTYLAILEDLNVKHIKLVTQWDWVEGKKDDFFFDDIDWQVSQAESHDASIIYVVGMKTGRWPECHVPTWADSLSKSQQQDSILQYIKEVVEKYKSNKSIVAWQAENEPLFNFGQCPWYDRDFLIKEVALIKSLDPTRPVVVSDSGEQSFWFDISKIGDIVGVTMYRTVFVRIFDGIGFYGAYPLPPVFYYRKAQIITYFFHKNVISVELQAEPWLSKPFNDSPLQEQEKSMNIMLFKNNIEYAKQTGFNEFYFWGAEWWYWLKTTQNKSAIWDEARKLFVN